MGKLAEAVGALDEIADHEERPAVSEDFRGLRHRAVLAVRAHAMSLPPGGGGAPSLSQTSEALGAKLYHGGLTGGVAVTPEELADLGRELP